MRSPSLAALILLTAACGPGFDSAPGPGDGGSSGAAPSVDAQTWLDRHNDVRRNPQPPPPSPLPPLTWSPDAAAVAQAWADQCRYQHNAGRGYRGENIAASAPPGHWGIADVVGAWAGEVQDYDYARNTCAPGKDCGHYTQIVWRDTSRVGCAHRLCQANSPFGPQAPNWDFWVCDYEPPGNVVGQRPY
jgi:pathogenesis-related protein 1